MHHCFQLFSVNRYIFEVSLRLCLCHWAHRRSLYARLRNKNMHKLHSDMNQLTSGQISSRSISQRTEMEDEKSRGWGLPGEGMVVLIRTFVLLPLLWWALGFNSVAPVCSGIRLLPWQSHTYFHSNRILLILCPANTQRRSHTHTHYQHTRIFLHARSSWVANTEHTTTYIGKLMCINTHSHRASTHIYCLSCVSMKKPEPWADLNWDSCLNHLLANSSLCQLQVESGSIASLSYRVQLSTWLCPWRCTTEVLQ